MQKLNWIDATERLPLEGQLVRAYSSNLGQVRVRYVGKDEAGVTIWILTAVCRDTGEYQTHPARIYTVECWFDEIAESCQYRLF